MFKNLMKGAALVAILACSPASANEFADGLNALAKNQIKAFAQSADVVAAIKAQNAETAGYDEAEILKLDNKWRAEADADSQPMIDGVLARPASEALAKIREDSDGLYTEIFVMDAKGLNVAQSDPTSDYWQGDEAKWQKTYQVGPDAIHLSEVEEDESTQTFQSQVSMSITDPADGSVIGAITVGVNVELLP
ncbi:PDC sensor domain-containing protein [Coralliovum pocilloporae]|uniref:PDC sensor domain-containing protein n=1 Tax=Coralliovum pocilloporae TaxID=3066369 RepID=UPI003307A5CF